MWTPHYSLDGRPVPLKSVSLVDILLMCMATITPSPPYDAGTEGRSDRTLAISGNTAVNVISCSRTQLLCIFHSFLVIISISVVRCHKTCICNKQYGGTSCLRNNIYMSNVLSSSTFN